LKTFQPTASTARLIAARQAKKASLAGEKNPEQVSDHDSFKLKINVVVPFLVWAGMVLHN
jgi:hypothetical protein